MNAGRIFLWSGVTVAAISFVIALIAGVSWDRRFRSSDGDQAAFDELLEEALARMDQGDVGGSKALTRRILAIDPTDPFARANRGRIAKSEGDYPRAIAEMKLAIARAPEVPDLYYDIACYYALTKHKEEAIGWLAKAFAHGFARRARMAEDADLATLKGEPRFETLVKTGRIPDGVPRVHVDAVTKVRKGKTFELTVKVVRDVLPEEALAARRELSLAWEPDPPLVLVGDPRIETASQVVKGGGYVELTTTGRYRVKSPDEGVFALPPVEVAAGDTRVDSDSLEVTVEP